MARQDAQLARNVVLALVVHTPRHGWAIHEELSPTGDIGRAWTLSRQLVYRAIDTLVEDGLVKEERIQLLNDIETLKLQLLDAVDQLPVLQRDARRAEHSYHQAERRFAHYQ